MSDTTVLNIHEVRAKLAAKGGREYWRSLEEIAETPEFKEFLTREFPREAGSWGEEFSRRDFLKVMGASLSLAGLTACVKQPEEKIVPYVKAPEYVVPGKPLKYATAFVMDGYATGVLATSHLGRPTHIEGNPDHPASLGACDVFASASVLDLYDPDRSQTVLFRGIVSSWEKFLQSSRPQIEAQRALKGAGLRLLTPNVTSPTLRWQIQSILAAFPAARWYQYEPCGLDAVREGMMMLFGEEVMPRYRFENADVILSLDADFLGTGPGHVRYAREFAARRRVSGTDVRMNRLYAAEPALHRQDFHSHGFEWLDCHDAARTILSFVRWAPGWTDPMAVVLNFTPVPREDFHLPVPFAGSWRVVLDTSAREFGGAGSPVPEVLHTVEGELHGRSQHLVLPLPGLTALFLKRVAG